MAHNVEQCEKDLAWFREENTRLLAQVAVCIRWMDERCVHNIEPLAEIKDDIARQARVLLDRLQKVEKEADLAKRLVRRLPLCQDHRDKFPAEVCLACRLQRAEAVVESANRVIFESSPHMSPSMGSLEKLTRALAAREEGKA